MTIGTVTLMVSGADVASTTSTPFNIVTASFTVTAGRTYLLCLAETASSNGVTAGAAGVNWQYQKTQTNGTTVVAELFGGPCTATSTGTVTLNWAASTTASYAIVEIQGAAATTPVVQKLSAAAETVTLAAGGNTQPASFLVGRNTTNAMTIKSGWTQVANIGTAQKLLVGYNATFDTTPSFTGTAATPCIIGAEIASSYIPAKMSLMMLGVG